jgi:hypothetical protein
VDVSVIAHVNLGIKIEVLALFEIFVVVVVFVVFVPKTDAARTIRYRRHESLVIQRPARF